uniref:Uncharacterized protein n=1 Tax=Rhizophora mucronata TaxID=61149 RepID=A0A2P2R2L0_RHIMU
MIVFWQRACCTCTTL